MKKNKLLISLATLFLISGVVSCSRGEATSPIKDDIWPTYNVSFYNYDQSKCLATYKVKKYDTAKFDVEYSAIDERVPLADKMYEYKFTEWARLDSEGNKTNNHSLEDIQADTKFAAISEKVERYYTVYFYTDSDCTKNFVEPISVKAGNKVVLPKTNPTKTADEISSYTFKEWNMKKELSEEIYSDLIVYPIWNVNYRTYKVNFYSADGSGTPIYTKEDRAGIAFECPDYKKPVKASVIGDELTTSYEFIGWSFNKNSSIADANESLQYVNKNMDVYAVFKEKVTVSSKKVWKDYIQTNKIETPLKTDYYLINLVPEVTSNSHYFGYNKSTVNDYFCFYRYRNEISTVYELEFTFKFKTSETGTGINGSLASGMIKYYSTSDARYNSNDYVIVPFTLTNFISDPITAYSFGEFVPGSAITTSGLCTTDSNLKSSYITMAKAYLNVELIEFAKHIKTYLNVHSDLPVIL